MPKALFGEALEHLPEGDFAINLWDGTYRRYSEGKPRFVLKINKPLSIAKMVKDPVLELGEAYIKGIIDVEGDFGDALRYVFKNQNHFFATPTGKLARQVFFRLRKQDSQGSRETDVQYHYDLGDDFFALWLDETMSYSCAYFNRPENTLKQAQMQKIDHILRKLQLQPGERLLDIGSGWGWLIVRAAQQYQVKALGITLSKEQYLATKELITRFGLEDLVEVELGDFREHTFSDAAFDKIASVGMLEHVGKAHLGNFLASVQKCLTPGGLALIHTITHQTEGEVNSWIRKYVFPGGYIPSLREVIWLLPEHGLHLLDAESLRMHYALTLDRWAERYEKNYERVLEERGERFARMWRLYLRSCAESFRTTGIAVHQILVSNGLNNSLPLTREHLYQ